MPKNIGSIVDLGNGKYRLRVSFTDDYGKRHQPSKVVTASGKREANKLLYEFYLECENDSTFNTSQPQTLSELYEEWLNNHVMKKLNNGTITNYKQYWERFLKDKGQIKLKNIRAKHIYEILDTVHAQKEIEGKTVTIETPRTQKAVYQLLKNIFNKGVMWGYMPSNPCNMVEPPNYTPKEKKTLTEENIKQIIDVIYNEELKYQAMFFFASLLGMRRQEIIALQWNDIDFKNKTVKISKAAEPVAGKGTQIKTTKNKTSNRLLQLPDLLVPVLIGIQNEQQLQKEKLRELWEDNDWIFTQWNGKLINIHTPTNWWKKFSERLDIKNVTFHCLRHTAASYMIKNNVPISTVSAVLGHADATTTLKIYTHVIEDTKAAAIKTMENVFTPEKSDKKENQKHIS